MIWGKRNNYNKKGLNIFFSNKDTSSTSNILLTVYGICIYILRHKKHKCTCNDLTAKISVLWYSHILIDSCLSDCCNNVQVYPYCLNMDRSFLALDGLVGDYLAYPTPIFFGTDEYFTRFCLHAVCISCWHMLNPQLGVECFETWFDSGYFNSLFRLNMFLGQKLLNKHFPTFHLSFNWPKQWRQL